MFPHVFAALLPKFFSPPEILLLTWRGTELLMPESCVEPIAAGTLTQLIELAQFS
jgi:hypothetical protein